MLIIVKITRMKRIFISINSLFTLQHSLFAQNFISNEPLEIAGFYRKKAMTDIFDSVYLFSSYTEEISFTTAQWVCMQRHKTPTEHTRKQHGSSCYWKDNFIWSIL
jgi:hypothetical protein